MPLYGASPLIAAEIFVCRSCSYRDIPAAIKAAQPGDRVVVGRGHYHLAASDPLLIDRPLTLAGQDYPVLDGGHRGHGIEVRSDSVHIEGLVLINNGKSDIEDYAAIYAEEVKGCTIRNNIMVNNAYGIYLAKADDCQIEGNILVGLEEREIFAGNGIHLWYSHRTGIERNFIYGHRDGLYFEFAEDLRLEGNLSEKNRRYGMHFMFSHRNVIRSNRFAHNPTGVALMYSKKLQMKNNVFLESYGGAAYGLLLKEINDSHISANTFSRNTVGIFMDTSNRNRIERNRILYNDWAMRVLGSSDQNLFTENAVCFNHFDVTTNSRENPNSYHRNYWSHYSGYDIDKDGFGDRPYRPVQIFSYWVNSYPKALLLLDSPLVYFLEYAEKLFPALSPPKLVDREPLMEEPAIQGYPPWGKRPAGYSPPQNGDDMQCGLR